MTFIRLIIIPIYLGSIQYNLLQKPSQGFIHGDLLLLSNGSLVFGLGGPKFLFMDVYDRFSFEKSARD